jgi:hypothetical protein
MKLMPDRKMMMKRGNKLPVMQTKHELMMRREPNHNVHVITHHGKVQVGRKGRKV